MDFTEKDRELLDKLGAKKTDDGYVVRRKSLVMEITSLMEIIYMVSIADPGGYFTARGSGKTLKEAVVNSFRFYERMKNAVCDTCRTAKELFEKSQEE